MDGNNLAAEAQGNLQVEEKKDTGAADVLFDKGKEAEASKGEGGKETDETGNVDKETGKGESGKEAEKSEVKEGEEKPEGPPDEYEEFAVPEGIVYDEELANEFKPIAKDLKLDQAGAQKLVDHYAEMQKRTQAAMIQTQTAFVKKLQDQAMADPEIGGANWKGKAEVNVGRALKVLGSEGMDQLINQNPALGNHPEFLKLLNKAGALLGEDSLVEARAGANAEKSTAEILFG